MSPLDEWDDLALRRREFATEDERVASRIGPVVLRVALVVVVLGLFGTAGYLVYRYRDRLEALMTSSSPEDSAEPSATNTASAPLKKSAARGKRGAPADTSVTVTAEGSKPEIIEVTPRSFDAEVLTAQGRRRIEGASHTYLLDIRNGKLKLLSADEADALASANNRPAVDDTVVLRVHLDATGTVRRVEAVSGDPAMRQRAIEVIRTTQFPPVTRDGKPVEGDVTMRLAAPRS